jgi:two-component system, NtrC family, sensor kinase
VLRVISSSPTNAQPVFNAIAESAVTLCGGQFSFVVRFDGKVMDFASCYGLSDEGLKAFRSLLPMPATEGTASGRATLRRAVVEIPDVLTDPAYGTQGLAKTVTYRALLRYLCCTKAIQSDRSPLLVQTLDISPSARSSS